MCMITEPEDGQAQESSKNDRTGGAGKPVVAHSVSHIALARSQWGEQGGIICRIVL
jgi:hypothetical protein